MLDPASLTPPARVHRRAFWTGVLGCIVLPALIGVLVVWGKASPGAMLLIIYPPPVLLAVALGAFVLGKRRVAGGLALGTLVGIGAGALICQACLAVAAGG